MNDLVVRPMLKTEADLRLFGQSFERNGSPRTQSRLLWQYKNNPTGAIYVDLALSHDRVASIYASLPIRMRVGGQVRLAMQSLDTLTDVDFRGKGLFVTLATSLFARAKEDGLALIYGFPNGSSAHGFFKRLEWTSLDPVPFLIRPLRSKYVLRKLEARNERLAAIVRRVPDVPIPVVPVPHRGFEFVDSFDERFTELWHDFAKDVGVAVERDSKYLAWRIRQKPEENYRTLAAVRGGRITGFVTFVVKEKHEGRIGYVMELIHLRNARLTGFALLQSALREMARDRADVALAWCLPHSPNHPAHIAAGFVSLPERLRPVELHVGVRSFDAAHRDLVADRRNWYLSYLDSDTV